jgi:hypothetical protein
MLAYRILTNEELELLENEFKQFLIVNHVYDQEWRKINIKAPEKAKELVVLFSNQVFHRVYEKIKFLEMRTLDSCFFFHFDIDTINLIAFSAKENEYVDFMSFQNGLVAIQKYLNQLSFFKTSKKYTKKREKEIHLLIEKGANPISKEEWDLIEKLTT